MGVLLVFGMLESHVEKSLDRVSQKFIRVNCAEGWPAGKKGEPSPDFDRGKFCDLFDGSVAG